MLVSFGLSAQETWNVQDEYQYRQKLNNEKEVKLYLDSLVHSGYYTLKLDSVQNVSNTYFITKGKRYKDLYLKLDSISASIIINPDEYQDQIPALKTKIIQDLEQKGYSFASVSSRLQNDTVYIDTNLHSQRKIDGFVIQSEEKFPKAFLYQLNKTYDGEIFNDQTLKDIDAELEQNAFISLKKPSQVLFLKDSTFIYTYPDKTKRSYFDGILGFTNNDSQELKITGNVDLQLGNVFNAFETIRLHWNSAANASQDFKLSAQFPYLGKSMLGSNTEMQIFRQDSTFVNFNLNENLYYHLNRRTQLGIIGFLQSSTYLENDTLSSNPNFKDFSKNGIGLSYQYKIGSSIRLFQQKLLALLYSNYINAHLEDAEKTTQYLISAEVQYLFPVNLKNYIATRFKYENLLADSFVNNELFRIGGIYSLRGFNENSILANQYLTGSIEYRFLPSEALYFSLFTDIAQVENQIQDQSNFLLGFGTGVTFQTKFGLFSLQYALGKFPGQAIRFDDSKIHIGIKALF